MIGECSACVGQLAWAPRNAAAAIVGLWCRGGEVEAVWPGARVRLADPGCPPDLHLGLVAELADMDSTLGYRSAVIVCAQLAADRWAWTHTTGSS